MDDYDEKELIYLALKIVQTFTPEEVCRELRAMREELRAGRRADPLSAARGGGGGRGRQRRRRRPRARTRARSHRRAHPARL